MGNVDKDEISLRDLGHVIKEWNKFLLSKWYLFILFGFCGAFIGFTYSKLKEPIYTATTTFALEEDKSGGGGLSSIVGLASIAGLDLGSGGSIFQGDNILVLYRSRIMIQKALLSPTTINGKSELIVDRYIESNRLREDWNKTPALKSINFSDTSSHRISRDSLLGEIVKMINEKHLSVSKPDKKLSIIKVDVSSNDELFSKAFNNSIVRNVNDFYIETKTKKSLQNVSILQQKTDSVRAIMKGAIYFASSIVDATPNLNPTRLAQRSAPVQQSQFSAETNKAVLTELVKNLELSKISLRKETPLIQVIDDPILPLEVSKLGKVKGAASGAFFAVFLTFLFLVLKRVFTKTLEDN